MYQIVYDYVHDAIEKRIKDIKAEFPDVDHGWLYSAILDHVNGGGTVDEVSISPKPEVAHVD